MGQVGYQGLGETIADWFGQRDRESAFGSAERC